MEDFFYFLGVCKQANIEADGLINLLLFVLDFFSEVSTLLEQNIVKVFIGLFSR